MRAVLRLVFLALVVLLFACGCNGSAIDPIVGTWNAVLFSVGGTVYTLPISNGISSIVVTIQANNTWTAVQVSTSTGSPVTSYPQGTWSVSGSTYTIIQTSPPPPAAYFTGAVSGNTLTITFTNSSSQLVIQTFTRQ
jgi:hypothetical protein